MTVKMKKISITSGFEGKFTRLVAVQAMDMLQSYTNSNYITS